MLWLQISGYILKLEVERCIYTENNSILTHSIYVHDLHKQKIQKNFMVEVYN